MFGKILKFGAGRRLAAVNENVPDACPCSKEKVSPSKVRALATGAALAVSVDTSPAVLVSIYDYAHHLRDRELRRIAC
jgi:hypothetical protein